jgi:undecaprenyl diphosphate synthase
MAKQIDLALPGGTKVPDHVVLIPDGDRRWARARGLTPQEGHRAGIENMANLARTCRDWGIHTVTAWGLSTENWLDRPKVEVDFLMTGIAAALQKYFSDMKDEGVRVVHLGRKDRLPDSIMNMVRKVEEATYKNDKHIFNLALDYNGPDEIMRAIKKMLVDEVDPNKVDRKLVDSYMDTAGQPYPYPDLIIRTSGEQRTSGILQWQSDYAEMYWESDHFPDFGPEKLREAVLDYSRRRRRFGGNDAEEHLKFDPKVVADLEIKWRYALSEGRSEKFRELVINYVREQYGLTRELAYDAGVNLAKALVYRREENWVEAKKALVGLYGIVQKNLKLAFEPEFVASIEVNLWKGKQNEEDIRQLLAEKFRFSSFQAAKSAHLAHLANVEVDKQNWEKAKIYTERYYQSLKERVA